MGQLNAFPWDSISSMTQYAQAAVEAVKVLQGYLKVPATGVADEATVTATNKTLGTNHDANYIVQNAIPLAEKVRLKAETGSPSGTSSGSSGSAAAAAQAARRKEAVKVLQGHLGVVADGIVGPITMAATNKILGTHYTAAYITQYAVPLTDQVLRIGRQRPPWYKNWKILLPIGLGSVVIIGASVWAGKASARKKLVAPTTP